MFGGQRDGFFGQATGHQAVGVGIAHFGAPCLSDFVQRCVRCHAQYIIGIRGGIGNKAFVQAVKAALAQPEDAGNLADEIDSAG